MSRENIYPTLKEYLSNGDDVGLLEFCQQLHGADLATGLGEATADEAAKVLGLLEPAVAAEVLSHFSAEFQLAVSLEIPDPGLAEIINRMSADDRVDLIKNIDEERQEKLLHMIAKSEREDILRLGSYEEGTAGSLTTSDYAALPAEITVREALGRLRLVAPDKETIYYIYVVDRRHRLLGLVSLRDLILSRPELTIEQIMHTDPVRAKVDEDQEEVAQKIQKYDLLAIPVTNGNETLIGIITHDDIHDVLAGEATEDFHRFGAVSHREPDFNLNISEAGFWVMLRKRLPWLLILVFMNIFSGAGIAYFETTIEAMVALVFFLPLLIASGGNAGSQSATLMIRAMAVGDVQNKDWFRLLGKEISVALAIGLILGAAVALIGVLRAGPEVAVVVTSAMVLTVLFGSLVGMSLPFLLTRLRLDPAAASAPLVTSIADIGGVLIYLSLATWYLRDLLAG
ncbi:MAG: magnesium transporter [Desulfurivibrio sp.]|nr:magnesium transporter [Desulfurivibrio sp.]